VTPRARPIDLRDVRPEDVLLGWPAGRPVVALCSGQSSGWSRWSVFAEPAETLVLGADALARLSQVWAGSKSSDASDPEPPFTSGWIGCLSYPLGRAIEPKAAHGAGPPDERSWPLAIWHRCPAALVFDAHRRQWFLTGDEPAGRMLLQQLKLQQSAGGGGGGRPFEVGPFQSRTGRDAYIAAAARIVEYIRAGDIFQANLAHRLTAPFQGSARALFARLVALAQPWFGAYIEGSDVPGRPRCAIASISPELFLQFDPRTRRVLTRPMKGTRPAGRPGDLATSTKDIAELNMIIDLMRNDLGRICELASIRVDETRVIEHHAGSSGQAHGVLQGVATISGILRAGASIADLLEATFPGGSVTGAPKIRAMQIIEELEPVARGPYCGAIGYVSDSGHAAFNIAIRTALLTGPPAAGAPGALDAFAPGSAIDFPVGAGIVADSDPRAEWDETLDKARTILSLSAGMLP
jgi:para-aminobenzoate synthetase component I